MTKIIKTGKNFINTKSLLYIVGSTTVIVFKVRDELKTHWLV